MSHCTDGVSTMATGSLLGHIAVWDLDERKLSSIQHDAHRGAVTGLQFIAEQPLLVTSSADNSVKVRMYWERGQNDPVCHTQTWIFDQSDGSARLLRQREGHSAPPTLVRFYTKGGLGLLTSGMTSDDMYFIWPQ